MNPIPIKVLLVEDDEDDVVLTRQLFADIEGVQFDVEWAADYDKGLEQLCGGRYEVCLVDYRLGLHDGVEFVREALHRGCNAPIILLTGQGDRAVDMAAMNAGAADYLNKADLRPADLERSIRYAMQHQRAQEQRVRLLTEQARRADAEAANRAKDQFLAALSHELRTPLTPVLFAVEDLEQDEGELPERVRESVALIKRNVHVEARLIDDLLDLTRVAHRKLELRRETVDVHAQLRHAIDTCGLGQTAAGTHAHGHPRGTAGTGGTPGGPTAGKRLELHVSAAAARHHATGDPARMQQVFWNLIKNAIKFTPDGGRIEVRTYNDSEGAVVIEVRDSGIGIEPEAVPRVFNAFEQIDRSITRHFGGLGLGLAICKALVDLHGGTIFAASPGPGLGATFTVRLQTTEPAAGAAGDRPAPARRRPAVVRAGGRILLVEDHDDTRKAMARLLEKQGHRVATADGIASALRAAREGRFDLLISDIGLSDGSGLELMRRLRELGPVKGIALSGYGMDQDLRQSAEAGFAEHITKPVDFLRLHDAVNRLLEDPEPEAAGLIP